MCKRLGYDRFIFAGYDSKEFEKHVLSKGWYHHGGPTIGVNASLAGCVYVITRILTDFDFSDEVRRGVMSVLNTVITGREIKENIRGREST